MASILGGVLGTAISTAINAATSAANAAANKNQNNNSSSSSSPSSSTSKAPSNYSGSATGIGVYDDYQQQIKDQMNANSQAWYNASTQEEKDALHAQNQYLAGLLGGNVSYDKGYWTGSAGAPQAPSIPQYTPTDNSAYLEEMAAAYLEQQKEALKQAYESNLSDLQAEQDKLGANYQSARNQEAASNALSRQRWNETAAAYGLNSGTAGQAQLSYANQLQSDLSALQAAETAANAEIERQRTNLGKEYQSAMTQAIAENNYQLYQQLYNEAVRVDQALQSQSQFNASLALQQYQAALDKYYNDQNFTYTQQQNNRNEQLAAAELLAQAGDYSAYGELFGWDDSKIQQMNNAWKAANTPIISSGSGGSTGSSVSNSYRDPLLAAYNAGAKTEEQAYRYLISAGYSDTEAMNMASAFEDEFGIGSESPVYEPMTETEFRVVFLNAVREFMNNGQRDAAAEYINAHALTEDQILQLNQMLQTTYGFGVEDL